MIESIASLTRAKQRNPENPWKKNLIKGLAAMALALVYFFNASAQPAAGEEVAFRCNQRVMAAIESNLDGTALPVLIKFSPSGEVNAVKNFSEDYPEIVGQAGHVAIGPDCAVLFDLIQEGKTNPEIWEWTPNGLEKILGSKEITLGLLFGARS